MSGGNEQGLGLGLGLGLARSSAQESVIPPYPAPEGFTWYRVTRNGAQVASAGSPVVYLKRKD